jgi:hypothetical protein
MRVRILRPFFYLKRNTNYKEGDVVDINQEEGEVWMAAGIAMQDKSLDGAKETKARAPKRRSSTKKK